MAYRIDTKNRRWRLAGLAMLSRSCCGSLGHRFVRGQPAPTSQQIRDAYPYGERAMWPYKVWLKRVKAWRLAHAAGKAEPAPPRHSRETGADDHETLNIFGDPQRGETP
jgi:hypothetical protein